MSSRPRQLLPRLGMADPDDVGAGLHQRLHDRLARPRSCRRSPAPCGTSGRWSFRAASGRRPCVRSLRSGNPISTACPARSSRAPTRTRVRRARRPRRAGAPSASGRRPAAPGRAATAGARGRTGRCCGAASCAPSSVPFARLRRATAAAATGSGGRPRAAGTAPRWQSWHTCSSKRPSAAAAVMPSATRPRAHGGRFICRVRRTGFLRLGFISGIVMTRSPQDHGAGAQAAVVGDHAEAGDQAELAHRAPRARRPCR